MKIPFFLLTIAALLVDAQKIPAQKEKRACVCDSPACPSHLLGRESLCACINQANEFCWRRSKGTCEKPVPVPCDGSAPMPTTSAALAGDTFIPPYQPEGGLNCVEIGYCYRPTKARTTMTINLPNGTAVITVPVGLPTADLTGPAGLPTPETTTAPEELETPIVFTPILEKRILPTAAVVAERWT